MKIHPTVFQIPHAKDFLPKIKKTSIKCIILNLKTIETHFSNIVFAYIAHGKFQKATFNSNRDIRQNVGLDGGDGEDGRDGDGPQNNTSIPPFFKNGREVKSSTVIPISSPDCEGYGRMNQLNAKN